METDTKTSSYIDLRFIVGTFKLRERIFLEQTMSWIIISMRCSWQTLNCKCCCTLIPSFHICPTHTKSCITFATFYFELNRGIYLFVIETLIKYIIFQPISRYFSLSRNKTYVFISYLFLKVIRCFYTKVHFGLLNDTQPRQFCPVDRSLTFTECSYHFNRACDVIKPTNMTWFPRL